MNELETELRDLFQAKVADAERPVDLLPWVRRRASRTVYRRIGAGALAGVALIAGVVLPTVQRHSGVKTLGGLINVNHKAPRGWMPVYFGTIQIWVPASWPIDSTGGCVGSQPAGVMYGDAPKKDCALPLNVLQIVDLRWNQDATRPVFPPRRLAPARRLDVNGLTVVVKPTVSHGLSEDVPALHLRLNARGPVAIRALGTLRRSPVADAAPGLRAALPAGFRWYEFGGIKFAAPAAWPARHETVAAACYPRVEPGRVTLSSRDPIYGLLCAGFATVHAGYLAHKSGIVVLSLPVDRSLPARSCARSHRKVRQFCVQGLEGFGDEYTLYLRRPGQKKMATVYVGLAGGGEVAQAIIDSIRPAPARSPGR
jgi:hypothetical protein